MQCLQIAHMRHDLTPTVSPARSGRPPLCICKSYPSRNLPSTTHSSSSSSSSRLSAAKAVQAAGVASTSRAESASILVPQKKVEPAGSVQGSKDEQEALRRRSQQAILSAYPFTLHQLVVFKVSIISCTCNKSVACVAARSPSRALGS